MRTITCNECGMSVAEDDFILRQCPVCDGFLEVNRLNTRVDSTLLQFIRIVREPSDTLVESV